MLVCSPVASVLLNQYITVVLLLFLIIIISIILTSDYLYTTPKVKCYVRRMSTFGSLIRRFRSYRTIAQ